jgi:hypothetical protein
MKTPPMTLTVCAAQLELLRRYSEGTAGTRRTIEAVGLRDYADPIIAIAQTDLRFPKPEETREHAANVARATAILQPLLRRGD